MLRFLIDSCFNCSIDSLCVQRLLRLPMYNLRLPLYNRTPVVSISQTKSNPEFEIPVITFRRSGDEDVTISGTGKRRRLVLPIIMSICCLCGQ
ncbi:hypothetical protein HanHA300_Chr16g0621741 [Helianthus annuus]|nr:hypothetical protein HanHA300_Chr16g0621741 [Helianthus annuus]KAJ0461471.1 hypothetical protein HanHA89_Chr16g0672641 [Helianthus annuus]KAJ0645765.1 hypothetical protein HanOQP8_Chr16g0627581 [Helianthus annuus]KAJ0822317.1 hypothetical protein HanPSC8_Chr16g0730611 [Helianthus annuus]